MTTVYMGVTADKHELPIAVSDTAKELGKLLGVSANVIHSSIYQNQNGKTRGVKFVKVILDREGE